MHIIGAGLSGLAAALTLSATGRAVTVYEAAPQAGGRCRSYYDRQLGAVIDNGNHLMMSANKAALAYLEEIGAGDTLIGPTTATFPFFDRETGAHYTVTPNDGPLPWWVLSPRRRVPGTVLADYLQALPVLLARGRRRIAEVTGPAHRLYRPFWEPLVLAVVNVPPEQAALAPLKAMLLETFAKGGAHCRPLIARDSLAASFIDPALATLKARGVRVQLNTRVRALAVEGRRLTDLRFAHETLTLSDEDMVVLATPPAVAAELVPGLEVPDDGAPIVNAHFRLEGGVPWPADAPLIGVLGGQAQWLFHRDGIVSVTVSAAYDLVDKPSEVLLPLLWADVAATLDLPAEPVPIGRIVKEKRATFVQSPENIARRPAAQTAFANLVLAGDWTDTGVPATIEGAVRSGRRAGDLCNTALGGRAHSNG